MVSFSRNNGSFWKTDGWEDVLIFQIKTTGVLYTLIKQHTLWKCQGHSFSKEKSTKSYCCITGVALNWWHWKATCEWVFVVILLLECPYPSSSSFLVFLPPPPPAHPPSSVLHWNDGLQFMTKYDFINEKVALLYSHVKYLKETILQMTMKNNM